MKTKEKLFEEINDIYEFHNGGVIYLHDSAKLLILNLIEQFAIQPHATTDKKEPTTSGTYKIDGTEQTSFTSVGKFNEWMKINHHTWNEQLSLNGFIEVDFNDLHDFANQYATSVKDGKE